MNLTPIQIAAVALSSAIASGQSQVYLDADTPATGSLLQTQPLLTALGTITFVGEVRLTSDPELAAAGSVGNVFDILTPNSDAELFFDFDVAAITFIYGGNAGGILLEARDAAGAVVDSFFQADTNAGQPAGPETLTGAGIRSLYWVDPGANFAAIDNVTLDTAGGGLGANYCSPANGNTSGGPANLSAMGSTTVANNLVTLRASGMPANQFGFFLASMTQGLVTNPGGSNGDLCLSGTIGRYVAAMQIKNSGAGGAFDLALDLSQTPAGPVFVSIAAGETWHFQCWFRDIGPMGQPQSNFTDGLSIVFD